MRKRYENPASLAAEQEVAQVLEDRWKCKLAKMPIAYHIDWMAIRQDKPVAFMELKCRTNPRQQYPTFMLSLAKWQHGIQMADIANIPFIVSVRWTDGLFYLPVDNDTPFDLGYGGRKDRGDWQDMEPVVYVPTNIFKEVA